jgi:L-fuconolactonase
MTVDATFSDEFEIVDAQLHVTRETGDANYEQYMPLRPLAATPAISVEAAIASMEAVGINAAVIDSPEFRVRADGTQGPDNSFALQTSLSCPAVFGALAYFDPCDPDIAAQVAEARSAGFLGARILIRTRAEEASFKAGTYDTFLVAAESSQLPVFCLAFRRLHLFAKIAELYPQLTLVIDHLGLPQMPWRMDDPPLKDLPRLLGLARYPNIVVKLSGAAAFSADAFPYADTWPMLRSIVDAFGPRRVVWGSDISRFFGALTHGELLGNVRYCELLSAEERRLILGGNIRRILSWPRLRQQGFAPGWRFNSDAPPAWLEN